MYGNPIQIPNIRKNRFRILRSLKLGEIVSFGNFARIASLCVGFLLGTLHGYYFHSDFWPNLNFPLEHQIKLVLNINVNDGTRVTNYLNNLDRHH